MEQGSSKEVEETAAVGKADEGSAARGQLEDHAALELEHAIGVSDVMDGAWFHPNERDYIHAAGGCVVIADFDDPHKQRFLRGHTAAVSCLALSPSGRLIASGQSGDESDVIVWDAENAYSLYRLSEHDGGVKCVAFSHDERLLCTCGGAADGKMLVWDMSTGNIVAIANQAPLPTAVVCFGGFVKDIKRRDTTDYLICAAGDKQIVFWHLNPYTGETTHERIHAEARGSLLRNVTSMRFSPDNDRVYCGATSGDVLIVDVRTRRALQSVDTCRLGVCTLCPMSNGLVVGGGDGSIVSFDSAMRELRRTQVDGAVTGLCLSPDTLEVVASTSNGSVFRVGLDSMAALPVAESHRGPINCVAFDGLTSDKFATASQDGTLRVWEAAEYVSVVSAAVKESGAPRALVYTGELLISGWQAGMIRAHDGDKDGSALWVIDNAHPPGVSALVASGNGRFIVSGGEDGGIRLWELRSRDLVAHMQQHSARITDLCLYEDDAHLISCSRDRSFMCWDLRTERRVSCHTQRMGGINSVALSHDQTQLITVGQEKRVTLWDLRQEDPVHVQSISPGTEAEEGVEDEARSISVSNDGRLFATGGTGETVKLWNFESCTQIAKCQGHSAGIRQVAFSPDGRQVVSAGDDGCLFIYNVNA